MITMNREKFSAFVTLMSYQIEIYYAKVGIQYRITHVRNYISQYLMSGHVYSEQED